MNLFTLADSIQKRDRQFSSKMFSEFFQASQQWAFHTTDLKQRMRDCESKSFYDADYHLEFG
jgi:hypothetical protein